MSEPTGKAEVSRTRLRREAGGAGQQHDAVQADAAELGGVADDEDFFGALDHLAVDAGLGLVVGGDAELQVEAHLASHLERLPTQDLGSHAIVGQMKRDEAAHADMADQAGANDLPQPVKTAMKLAAKVMTTVAFRV